MKRLYAAIAALLVLASASTVKAQPHPGGYYYIKLLDSVSVTKGDWNAVCDVYTYIWIVGDSGKVRRYHVLKDADDRFHLDDTLDFTLGGNYTLCDVCFPTNQYGYIVGYEQREVGGGETPGVIVPGKGKIWRTTNSGANWIPVSDTNMPLAFQQKPIPCLSVDFYDAQYGYVGCGCGYVLYSNDFGVSWRALDDTTLQKKLPWDSVGFHIGSIPRGYHPEEGYYNHFGDWLTECISLLESNND